MSTASFGYDPKMDYGNSHGGADPSLDLTGDINKLATSQNGAGGLPSWLNHDPNSLTRELRQTYKGIPGMFDSSGIGKTYDNEIDSVKGIGGQIATNAAKEAMARAQQTGGDSNSEMAKAQAMLPVYAQTGSLAKDKAASMLQAAQAQASLQAQVSGTLGQLRTSYLANLAQTHMMSKQLKSGVQTNAAQLALSKYQGDQSHQLSIENMAQQQGQFESQQELEKQKFGAQLAQDVRKTGGMYFTDPSTGAFSGGDRAFFDANKGLGNVLPQFLPGLTR